MRLRNIPGAKDAILDCEWVIDEPERFKGKECTGLQVYPYRSVIG